MEESSREEQEAKDILGINPSRAQEAQSIPEISWTQSISQGLFFLILLILIIWAIADWKQLVFAFDIFKDWISDHPYRAIAAIVCFYTVCVVFMLPLLQFHLLFSYTYSKIFDGELKGFFIGAATIYVGMMCGAAVSFILSRYMFRS